MIEQQKMIEELKTTIEKTNNKATESIIIDSVPHVPPEPAIIVMDHTIDHGLTSAIAMGFHHHGFAVVPATNAGMEQLIKQNNEPIEFKLHSSHYVRGITPKPSTYIRSQPKVSRNALCPCGSKKKSKRCCNKD